MTTNRPLSALHLLPSPSTEQQSVIDAILSGNCVAIPSVAGSGKTTTMLQIASNLPTNRRVIIVTYNRSLSDECRGRIIKCGLRERAWCYTIHGLVSKVAGQICNDDHKLINVVNQWDADSNANGYAESQITLSNLDLDLLMLDEAQDLRPSFYKALCHIIKLNHNPNKGQRGLQMCLVGDPKQMLYDFPTYGDDKASSRYMEHPQQYWGRFTDSRTWVTRKLTISYRLTPNIASFVNTIWGTSIQGGNTAAGNLPVEYLCRYPYPAKTDNDRVKLQTSFLSGLIDEHGPENIMFIAQSVKNHFCPIRVHVNALMKEKNTAGGQKYSFHIKESTRGFEGSDDITNKVRVWTFCGSKGCEADCVVVFGLDMFNPERVHSLNQVGVALSRARKRLIVIHGKHFINKNVCDHAYYPMLGDVDVDEGEKELTHRVDCNGKEYRYDIPNIPKELGQGDREKVLICRSKLTQQAMEDLANNAVICLKHNEFLPFKFEKQLICEKAVFYLASDFNYFAASEEERFLSYGAWTKERDVVDRIDYIVDVQFERTKEDVSALYGEALMYMFQWERDSFCPNIETVVNNGILQFNVISRYKEQDVRIRLKACEPLSPAHETLFCQEFKDTAGMKGKELIHFLNTRIKLKMKRVDRDRIRYFPVKAVEFIKEDTQMREYQIQIKSVYEAPNKSPSQWIYLANAVMASGQYHDKWNQIGTDPESYNKWVESNALLEALSRISKLMKNVPPIATSEILTMQEDDDEANQGIEFERRVLYEFPPEQCIKGNNSHRKVMGVQGFCDWIGQGLVSEMGNEVDLLELKFVNQLGNVNRLQVLAYCALLSLETGRSCSGMLYNARTGELEICRIEAATAKNFLLDISQFKCNGTSRHVQASLTKEAKHTVKPQRIDAAMSTSSSTIARDDRRRKMMNSSIIVDLTKLSSDIDDTKFVERKKLRSTEVKPDFSLLVQDTAIIDLTLDSSDDEDAQILHKKGIFERGSTHLL